MSQSSVIRGPRSRGAILLELIAASAIFSMCALAILALISRGIAATERVRQAERAADLARSAMAAIEVGLATPETVGGPVAEWSSGGRLWSSIADDAGFADALPDQSPWTLEAASEPSGFDGLTLVTIEARRTAGEQVLASASLTQLVRLRPEGEDRAGERDGLDEQAWPTPREGRR